MPSDMKWREREKWNDKEHHEKASFFHIAEYLNGFCFILFLRKHLLHYVICSCRKKFKWNSQKQPFADVLKNVLMFAKNLCSRLFLIKLGAWRPAFLLKKRFQHRCFPVNIAKFLRTANSFLVEHFLFIILLRDDRILWTSLGTKLTSFIFLVLLLCFPSYRESTVISYLFLYQNC